MDNFVGVVVRPIEAVATALGPVTTVSVMAVKLVEAVSVALGAVRTGALVAVRPVESVSWPWGQWRPCRWRR